MRITISACLTAVLAIGLASCKCGDATEQLPGPAAASDVDEQSAKSDQPPKPADPSKQVTCPVCGLEFGAGEATATYEHDGTTYHFLLQDHKDAFAADPASFLEKPEP